MSMNRAEKRRLFGANPINKRIVSWNDRINTEVFKPIKCEEICDETSKEGLTIDFFEENYDKLFEDFTSASEGITSAEILTFKKSEWSKTPLKWLKQIKKIILHSIDGTIDIFNIRDIKGTDKIKQVELYTTGTIDGRNITEYKWSMLIDISSFPFSYTVWKEIDRPKNPSESMKQFESRPHFQLIALNNDLYTNRLCQMTAQLMIVSAFTLSFTGFVNINEKWGRVTMIPLTPIIPLRNL